MLRIALFLLTNLAIVIVASITLSLLGFEGYLAANGVDLNLSSLLVFCFVFGMAGSVVSLLLSKKMAKMGTGTQIIEQPWLFNNLCTRTHLCHFFRQEKADYAPGHTKNKTEDQKAREV